MKDFLQKMSRGQYAWLTTCICLMAALFSLGMIQEIRIQPKRPLVFSREMAIKQIAPKLGVNEKALAREFDLSLNVNKYQSLKNLGVDQRKFNHVVRHLLGHRNSVLKYYLFAIFVLWGWFFLVHVGRPNGMQLSQRRRWYPQAGRLVPLMVAVALAGFLTGKSPNPMEGTVKVFKSMAGLYPDIWEKTAAFGFFIALAVFGNKLICGWACPFGALQELIYSLPFLKRIKRHKLPFAVTNTIRCILFLTMLFLLFGMVGGKKGFVIYHYINPFNLFNLEFETASTLITVLAALGFALIFYRPFCQLICPFGFLSWMAEGISLYRVTIDTKACIQCDACARVCPLPAMEGRLRGKFSPADCFSCARCLNVCPVDAIRYASTLNSYMRKWVNKKEKTD